MARKRFVYLVWVKDYDISDNVVNRVEIVFEERHDADRHVAGRNSAGYRIEEMEVIG